MTVHHIIKQEIARQPDLPVLPPGISSLLKMLNDDDIGYSELADKLENFPSIAIKIVSTANSAWASPGTPITTLRSCCARIGVPVVRSIAIAIAVAQIFDPSRCPAFDAKKYWLSALLTAEAAQLCAKDNNDVCSDTARLAGLLHNIGLLWLATQKPKATSKAINFKKSNEALSLAHCMAQYVEVDYFTAGGYLASFLELPEQLSELIACPALNIVQDDIAMQNHHRALQLASSALTANNTAEHDEIIEDPCFDPLMHKLPGIETMARSLFFS